MAFFLAFFKLNHPLLEEFFMFENFGQKIRALREQKGISLNKFAKSLNVSPSYLSTLETGQRTKVDLSFLQKIEKELKIVSSELNTSPQGKFNDFRSRIEKVLHNLAIIERSNPKAANYWLTILEEGLQLYHQADSPLKNSQEYH